MLVDLGNEAVFEEQFGHFSDIDEDSYEIKQAELAIKPLHLHLFKNYVLNLFDDFQPYH
jgi:hypothetical protein